MSCRRRVLPHSAPGACRGHGTARLVAALATVVALTASTAPAGAAPGQVMARGRMTISGARSGVASFTLPRAVPFRITSTFTAPEITVEGRGRFAGIAIAQEGATFESGAILWAIRYNGCWSAGCRTPTDERAFPYVMAGSLHTMDKATGDGGRTSVLPAGRYKAYLVSDGAPVAVTVRFAGLAGSVALVPSRPARTTFATAVSSVAGAPSAAQVMYSAGARAEVSAAAGLVVTSMEARSVVHARTVSGQCYYQGDTEPPNGLHVPGCPHGTPGSVFNIGYIAPGVHQGVMSAAVVKGSGAWAVGQFFDGAHVPESLSPTAILWLSLT